MQETPNPLAPKPVLQPKKPSNLDDMFGVPKQVWITAGILAVLMLLTYLGYVIWDKNRSLKDAKAAAETAQAVKSKDDTELNDLKNKLAQAQAEVEALQREKQAAVQAVQNHKSFEDEMRAALESKDVTISKLQGRLTVNILDQILFESGEARLKPEGEAVLMKVGNFIKQHPQIKLHVVGHTDNIPIRAGARNRFASNWELSTARATSAVRFMCEQGGANPAQLGAVGYGEFRPVASNETEQGRAKNRRIEITVLPDEQAIASTNAPVAASPVVVNTNHVQTASNGHHRAHSSVSNTVPATAAVVTNKTEDAAAETNTPTGE